MYRHVVSVLHLSSVLLPRTCFKLIYLKIAELMVKVRAKLGELNATETSHADLPSWGAANLKKLGKVVLGLTKDELKRFPIRGIEDSVEVMGKNSGWRRGQVCYVYFQGSFLSLTMTSINYFPVGFDTTRFPFEFGPFGICHFNACVLTIFTLDIWHMPF